MLFLVVGYQHLSVSWDCETGFRLEIIYDASVTTELRSSIYSQASTVGECYCRDGG